MTFKVLSCDGGGIRGLITALLIEDLDKKFGVISKADGFAGTSTGGLIALGLAHGVSIDKIVSIYKNDGKEIFKPNGWLLEEGKVYQGSADGKEGAFEGPGYFECEYVNTGIKKLAESLFSDAKLSSSKRFVAVNSARLWNEQDSWEPVTLSNTLDNVYRDVKMVDASLATSAAPTYFPPYDIAPFGFFADGGTFANNPSMSAIAEIMSANLVDNLSDIRVLSLGTGLSPEGLSPSVVGKPTDWGSTKWLWPRASKGVPSMALLQLALDCSASMETKQAQKLLQKQFKRGNFKLSSAIPLDDYKAVRKLEDYVCTYIQSLDWQKVCTWVDENWK